MRVLLVEDQPEQAEAVTSAFDEGVVFDVATNRDEALALIDGRNYDVAVCDLKIPPSAGTVAEVEHGLAVLTAIRARCPGTPIIGFTAYKTKEVLDLLLGEQRQEDFLGTQLSRPMLSVIDKDELPEFLRLLGDLQGEFDALDNIDLVLGLGQQELDSLTCRVLRVYARQRSCVIVRVTPFTGGRSGVPVLRVKMEKSDGTAGGSAVARIANIADVDEERRRFQQRVSGVLPLGTYAEIVGVVQAGAGPRGGVFYQLAEDFRPIFAVMAEDDDRAATAVDRLQFVQSNWRAGAPADEVPTRDIRRVLIADEPWRDSLSRCDLNEEAVEVIERSRVLIRRGTVHGDLHGANVLVASDSVIIDFAAVTEGPTPLDPICLELSLLFHPGAPKWGGDWPAPDQLERWADFEEYVQGCPFPQFLHACRKWATEVARGNRDVYASAYSYTASQARFATSNPVRLAPLMRGLATLLQ
jgi:CheY-like chemotaxis protein